MLRRLIALLWGISSLGVVLATTLGSSISSSYAQGSIHALTHYALTVYNAPGRDYAIIGVLIPHAKIILEARSADAAWVLGRTTDGSIRGWMESRYLTIPPDVAVVSILVSTETIYVPDHLFLAHKYADIDLDNYPVIPTTMGQARAIFERGQLLGAEPNRLSKIGDCISDNEHFLSPFGNNRYNLGTYTRLQGVVNFFSESLSYDSLAAYDGLVTSAVLDSLFSNPLVCLPGETPLRCELRVHQPSVAVIMFGAQDLLFTPPEEFDTNLRRIVHETIQAGVIPVLSTFPGNLELWDKSVFYNQIVVQVALDYDIPLMNFWRALNALPNHGLNDDGRHLSLPLTFSGDLRDDNLLRGYPLRNLVTLRTVDALWRSIMVP